MYRAVSAVGGVMMLLACAAGCGKAAAPVGFSEDTKWVLAAPERFEVAALDPEAAVGAGDASLHGVKVVWRGELRDEAVRRGLVESLYGSVVRDPAPKGCMFVPHHAIIATRGDKRVEMLVCFHCGDVETWGGAKREEVQIEGTPEVFDAALRAAGMAGAATEAAR